MQKQDSKAKDIVEDVELFLNEDGSIDYDHVRQNIIGKVLNSETSVPVNPEGLTVQYNGSKVNFLPVWVDLNEDSILYDPFGLGKQEIKISYPGNDRYPASEIVKEIVVKEAGEETQMTLTGGLYITFAPEEEMKQALYNAVLPQVQTREGNLVVTTIDDFEISFENTTGDVEVTFRYKGKVNEYKSCEGKVLVHVKKGKVSVSVDCQNITYGENFTDPIVSQRARQVSIT